MKKLMLTIAFAGAAIGSLGLESAAQATTFYLGNGLSLPEVSPSFSYSEDGYSLTVRGLLENGNFRNVYRSPLGLGVTNRIIADLESNQVDGIGLDETLRLTFNTQVKLVSATFARVGSNDSFKLVVDGNHFISADIPGGNLLDLDISDFTFNPSPTGTVFGFTVNDNNDGYLLKYVEVSAVPEPLTMLGVGSAIGFGSFFKRKLAKTSK